VLTFKLTCTKMHLASPDPLAGLRGCGAGKREMDEKERGRGDRGWEEKVEERIAKWEGKGGEGRVEGEGGEGKGRKICLVLD